VLDVLPAKERYEYERIKNLPKQKWIRKFPPLATCGDEAYNRLKNHAQIEYHSTGVEDFALHLPDKVVPSKRVLLLRYRNRFDTLVQSLVLRGINVTSAYPVTWMKKEWSPQEERLAREVDVVYFHEIHAVKEWCARLGTNRDREPVAACHDIEVARVAKELGFKDAFFAKQAHTEGLFKTVRDAVDFAKSPERRALYAGAKK
jgi:uroporphyrinogen-III synthase